MKDLLVFFAHRIPPTSKPAIQQTSKLAKYKKATYYLAPEMIRGIKRLAVDRDMDISVLVREIIGKYLKET